MTASEAQSSTTSKIIPDRTTKKRRTATATSPAAMGRALVLLATTCAAFGTHDGRMAAHPAAASRGAQSCYRVQRVALRYRDGDEDQPVSTRVRLSEDVAGEQLVMDEYLEFVERRHRRLHPWQRREERKADALNALGLSGLASYRLRRRLHVPRDVREQAHVLSPLSRLHPGHRAATPPSALSSTTLSSTSSDITTSFSAHLGLLDVALRRLTGAFGALRVLASLAGRTAAGVAAGGGGGRSARALGPALSCASVLLLVVFRPVYQGMFRSTGA